MCRALTLLVRAANLHNSRAFAVFLGLASLAWRFADDWLCVVTGTVPTRSPDRLLCPGMLQRSSIPQDD